MKRYKRYESKNYAISHNQKLYFGDIEGNKFRQDFFRELQDTLDNKDRLSKEERGKKLRNLGDIAKEHGWLDEFIDDVEFWNKRHINKK